MKKIVSITLVFFIIGGVSFEFLSSYFSERSGPFHNLKYSGGRESAEMALIEELDKRISSGESIEFTASFMKRLGFSCAYWKDDILHQYNSSLNTKWSSGQMCKYSYSRYFTYPYWWSVSLFSYGDNKQFRSYISRIE